MTASQGQMAWRIVCEAEVSRYSSTTACTESCWWRLLTAFDGGVPLKTVPRIAIFLRTFLANSDHRLRLSTTKGMKTPPVSSTLARCLPSCLRSGSPSFPWFTLLSDTGLVTVTSENVGSKSEWKMSPGWSWWSDKTLCSLLVSALSRSKAWKMTSWWHRDSECGRGHGHIQGGTCPRGQ